MPPIVPVLSAPRRALALLAAFMVLQSALAFAQTGSVTLALREVALTYPAEAVVEAVRQATVAAQVQGRVIDVRADAGQRVQKGQLLMRIDAREAAAGAAGAQAQLVEAEANYERTRNLHARKFVSAAALDKAEAELKAARAVAGASGAAVSHATVMAPGSPFPTTTPIPTRASPASKAPFAAIVPAPSSPRRRTRSSSRGGSRRRQRCHRFARHRDGAAGRRRRPAPHRAWRDGLARQAADHRLRSQGHARHRQHPAVQAGGSQAWRHGAPGVPRSRAVGGRDARGSAAHRRCAQPHRDGAALSSGRRAWRDSRPCRRKRCSGAAR